MKGNTSLTTGLFIWLFFIVSVLGFFLCVWAILPMVARSIDGERVKGDIISIEQSGNEYKLRYAYTDHYKNTEYNLVKRINEETYVKLKGSNTMDVIYSRYFPKRVYLPSIENDSYSIVILAIGLIAMSILFYRSFLVIRGKLSVEKFMGVKQSKAT